jgi:flagellar L-ring protein precursor FlgH
MKKLLTILSVLSLTACSSVMPMDERPDDPDFAPVPAQSLKPPAISDGSLYQNNYAISLYSDQRARRIGDVITVMLQEQTNASKSNSASTSKDSELTITPTSLFGGIHPALASSLTGERSFSGQGDTGQSNSLDGQITVTISAIYPNGILEIRGEKWLSLNQGDEFIRVRGLVRPEDIGSDNTVQSSKLADARISYGGTGYIASASKPGWVTRFFNSEWWPF